MCLLRSVFVQSCGNLPLVNVDTLLLHLNQFSIDFVDLLNKLV